MSFTAIIFDFDGVILDSEIASNRHLAAYLTKLGHPTSLEQSIERFIGLSGARFAAAVEDWIGAALPADFDLQMRAAHDRFLKDGLPPIAGAPDFIRSLPGGLPRAVASSSSTGWIAGHLDHLGLRAAFGDALFSGKEHVARGKPAPDIYLHAAYRLGVRADRALVIEDSPVGVRAASDAGAQVIGLVAGDHCPADLGAILLEAGAREIAYSYADVARITA